jgi:hypothetical protein
MLARRDTQREAARLRHLSPLQTLENQSQTWGIRCHSCTWREGLSPSWPLSYKIYILRFTREPKFSFNQRIARTPTMACLKMAQCSQSPHTEHSETRCCRPVESLVEAFGSPHSEDTGYPVLRRLGSLVGPHRRYPHEPHEPH